MEFDCPICHDQSPVRVSGSVRLSYGSICACRRCGSGIMLPRPSSEELKNLHSSLDYLNHEYFESRRAADGPIRIQYERRVREIRACFPGDRVLSSLDVGCDTGSFVRFLEETGKFRATGIDISESAVERGRKEGLDLRAGELSRQGFADGSFDVITALDLLEHVSDPAAFLKEAYRVIAPSGVLILETPNFNGLVYRIGRLLARAPVGGRTVSALQERLWPRFHVQYFTRKSLDRSLKEAGFRSTRVAGREIPADLVAVANPLLRASVQGVFSVSLVLASPTLLFAIARK
jgi:2-polyprenyl-3-methyl-5-hydroxy-6-metoxy-1,4-benzoquinol methylase